MFSATLDPAQVNDFALDLLKKPKRIAIGSAHTEHKDITKRFYLCDHLDHKQALLEHFLQTETYQQVIIFTATRSDTERLSTILAEQGLSTTALSGDLNQSQRNQIMDGFSKGQQKILVTTDLASRGLDLVNVSHVINFDMPKHTEEFVHRIGRKGRAGSTGDAISFVGPKDWLSFKNVEAFLQQSISFDVVKGLKAKFSGLKPKKDKLTKGNAKKAPVKAMKQPKRNQKATKKTFHIAKEVGDLPVLRRKVVLTPEEIDQNNIEEVE